MTDPPSRKTNKNSRFRDQVQGAMDSRQAGSRRRHIFLLEDEEAGRP